MSMTSESYKTGTKRVVALLCATMLASINIYGDPTSPAPDAPTAQATTQAPPPTPEQIDSLVAPIALYPDELVSQILVASTYPLEIVQAYQWVQQHPELKGQDLTKAAQQQSWDPSVQALVAFPDVLKRMNQDVTWTTNLGNAFLASQANVMDEIQKMRSRAEEAGKLKSTEQQKVVNTTDEGHPVVEIEPASPDVVYVPDYDPVWIWGPAPVYYPYPYWYYPPAPVIGWCWWGGGIYLNAVFWGWNGWGGWGWHPGWYGHRVFINNTFIVSNHFNAVHGNFANGRAVWSHDATHRMGVAYPNRGLAQHFNAARPGFAHVSVAQARQQFHASATRVNANRSFDRFGSRQVGSSVYNRNRSAFGSIGNGSSARAFSNRGNASLGHARSGAVRSGGGSRGGGGSGGGGHMGGGGGGGWGGGGGGGGHH